jgi:SAM-dependent methyltransferase
MSGRVHNSLVLNRRAEVLANHLASMLSDNARVLDIGCGDGLVGHLVQRRRPDVVITGVDVLARPASQIPVQSFDGLTIPYCDLSFNTAMLVDVLHHTEDPLSLLKEACRVARTVLVKDHLREGFLAVATLRFMDWVGNAHHGVALPYNYWSEAQWDAAFKALHCTPLNMIRSLRLYPAPASWLFERKLHFIANLESS